MRIGKGPPDPTACLDCGLTATLRHLELCPKRRERLAMERRMRLLASVYAWPRGQVLRSSA